MTCGDFSYNMIARKIVFNKEREKSMSDENEKELETPEEQTEENEDEYGPDILTLVDDDGVEHEFEVVDTLNTEENEYFALIPTEDAENVSDEDGQLVILKVVQENDEEFLEPIEDEDEFNQISEIFMDRLEEYYDFEDDEEDSEEK